LGHFPARGARLGSTCARVSDGRVLCWGDNGQGQLGDQTNLDDRRPSDVYAVPCGGSGTSNACGACRPTTCAAQGMSSGSIGDGCGGVLQCGAGGVATLGGGESHWCELANGGVRCWGLNNKGQTEPVTDAGPYTWVSSLGDASCGILSNRELSCWGADGQLQVSSAPLSEPAEKAEVGYEHACTINADNGHVRCWGKNAEGQATAPWP
jgi:hypothetical protein